MNTEPKILLTINLEGGILLKGEPELRKYYLTKKDLKENDFKIGDTEGFVNYGLSIDVVQFTAFFTDRENRVRVSFRSKGDFDVNIFARKHFNGGGHHNAAGAFFNGTIEEAIKHFEKVVKQEVKPAKNKK